jgi:cysteine-rich repeat protein
LGWNYEKPPTPVFLPTYWSLFAPASNALSLAAHEFPTHDLQSTSMEFFDAPGNVCLPGEQDFATRVYADSVCGAPCGSTTISGSQLRAPPGSAMVISTHLVGVAGALPGAEIVDTGIGFTWTSTFNGTTGGVSVIINVNHPDPGSGSGGITITSFTDTTNYVYNGITVKTVNGAPSPACGNGILEGSEECDDGVANGSCGDKCSSTCQLHRCGDGVVDPGEACDLGCQNGAAGSGCSATCQTVAPPAPPSCALTSVLTGPPKQLQITVQSPNVGLASIVVTDSTNATVAVPAFSSGDTTAQVVVATKIDQMSGAHVALQVTDTRGQVTDCDPVVPADPGTLNPAPEARGCSVQRAGGKFGLGGLLGVLLGLALFGGRRISAWRRVKRSPQ